MRERSSYLRYLPPVVWQDDDPASGVSVGGLLRIVEKILTGIPDGVPLPHGAHEHAAITDVIAGVDSYFDPWRTPAEFLPWLASWVALSFPTVQGTPIWDEYQQRRVTSRIAQAHRGRGLRSGLRTYLDLYTPGSPRARVAVDDGSRLLFAVPRPDEPAPIGVLVGQGPQLRGSTVLAEGLVRPWCVARASTGDLFVGDTGVPAAIPHVPVTLPNRVWQISTSGAYRFTGVPPRPRPTAPSSSFGPVWAIAVRPANGGTPETVYWVDSRGALLAVPAPFDAAQATAVATLTVKAAGGQSIPVSPVAMAVDVNGDLLVLHRGSGLGTPDPPRVLTVKVGGATPSVSDHALATVVEPMSLLVRADGTLLVGDGGSQDPAGPDDLHGNLVAIDRGTAPNWTETALLPVGNPLVAPTALAETGDGGLFVLDVGLKPFASTSDPFVRAVAEPAVVHRVGPGATPQVTRISEAGSMVFPTGMARDGDRLVICDPGLPAPPSVNPVWPRIDPFRFDVVVHFVGDDLPDDQTQRSLLLQRVIANIGDVVEQNRPAHLYWAPITEA
ncbi:phage tail protein [Frankia sp. CiP3]|uniref:phage tail protein n=1 Tax=Frankia sp. CiP3 TaxID=2880971 RepID=UPI001EF48329|nr:phage tail protein [Frankia sp. CiP3]